MSPCCWFMALKSKFNASDVRSLLTEKIWEFSGWVGRDSVPYEFNAYMTGLGVNLYLALVKVGLKCNEIHAYCRFCLWWILRTELSQSMLSALRPRLSSSLNRCVHVFCFLPNQDLLREELESHIKMIVYDDDFSNIGPFEAPKPEHWRIERVLPHWSILMTCCRQVQFRVQLHHLSHQKRDDTNMQIEVRKDKREWYALFSDFCEGSNQFAYLVRENLLCKSTHWWVGLHFKEDRISATFGYAIEKFTLMRRIAYNIV